MWFWNILGDPWRYIMCFMYSMLGFRYNQQPMWFWIHIRHFVLHLQCRFYREWPDMRGVLTWKLPGVCGLFSVCQLSHWVVFYCCWSIFVKCLRVVSGRDVFQYGRIVVFGTMCTMSIWIIFDFGGSQRSQCVCTLYSRHLLYRVWYN